MRRIALGLCGLLVLGLVTAIHAEEPTPEKMAKSEKAYKKISEFLMADGGVWKATIKQGERIDGKWTPTGETKESVHEYRWVGEGRFLQQIGRNNGEKSDTIHIFGVDSVSGELTWWRFGKNGMWPSASALQDDGTWVLHARFTNDKGQEIAWNLTMTLNKDEIVSVESATVDGVKVPKENLAPPEIWKRDRK